MGMRDSFGYSLQLENQEDLAFGLDISVRYLISMNSVIRTLSLGDFHYLENGGRQLGFPSKARAKNFNLDATFLPFSFQMVYHYPVLKEKEWPLLEEKGVVKKAACSRTSLRIEPPRLRRYRLAKISLLVKDGCEWKERRLHCIYVTISLSSHGKRFFLPPNSICPSIPQTLS
jgi:hypothetical protein